MLKIHAPINANLAVSGRRTSNKASQTCAGRRQEHWRPLTRNPRHNRKRPHIVTVFALRFESLPRHRKYRSNAARQAAYRKRKRQAVYLRSKSQLWETPAKLFSELDREFRFTVDVCAVAGNRKCENFFSPEEDGLKQRWTAVVWSNPPYGRDLRRSTKTPRRI